MKLPALVVALALSITGVARAEVYLAWTSGGLPAGFADAVRHVPGVTALAVVRSDNVDLLHAWDAAGLPARSPPPGWFFPLEAMLFAPAELAAFAPEVAGLAAGDALLSETSARLRGIAAGGRIELATGDTFVIRVVVPDAVIGGGEVAFAVSARTIAVVPTERYVLLRHEGDRASLEHALAALVRVPVRVRTAEETPILRHADQVLTQAQIKARFGEFADRTGAGLAIERDSAWVAANIIDAALPILGPVRCHRALIAPLAGALADVAAAGLRALIDPAKFSGCDSARRIAGNKGLSRHAWGAAIDLDNGLDPRSTTIDPRIVAIFARWGLTSGHDWLAPDPGHYEWFGVP